MNHNFVENDLMILTKETLDIFLKQDNPSELISLYTFYYYTAKWQGTNQPKCTTGYVSKGLHWSRTKVAKIKKQLLEFGLIEDSRIIDEQTKRVKGYYIKMNYIFKKSTLEKSQCTQKPPTGNKNSKASVLKSEGVEFEDTNALSDNNLNALSANNIYEENFEKLWGLLKPNSNDRKKKVSKKRKKELYEMGFERAKKAIELYLKVQEPTYYHKRDNFFNDIIDNYLDKSVKDFDLNGKTGLDMEINYDIEAYEKLTAYDYLKAFYPESYPESEEKPNSV